MPLSTTLSDAALIERSWRDPGDFALLFDRHAGHIHRYVARRLGDEPPFWPRPARSAGPGPGWSARGV
ncbi:hypothetical protein SAMN05216276_103426 [Streptosporangium subroseum]|uniref:RNA polymerase sigma-70 factor, ECF subfamily n=1 Tax=Streptosporangium subroseum TaxID=106412 RepID=A0A239LPW9_9ACTN|nr:hypothetical protein SAMN05216276_103426 [Streptosporangium subroseum]